MHLKHSLGLCVLIVSTVLSSDHYDFNYEDHGPDEWPFVEKQCGGSQQSPVNIDTTEIIYKLELKPFEFINYNTIATFNLENNNHTIVFHPANAAVSQLKFNGSDFSKSYTLSKFHFHWGENIYQGSEHYIDEKKYPLEMHLVHENGNSTAVLGFLFSLDQQKNNEALDTLLDALGKPDDLVNLNLSSILPSKNDLNNYYRYMGSLTTPPCTEGVIWTVFETPIPISPSQLKKFAIETKIKKNFREPQKLNCRKITSSKTQGPSSKPTCPKDDSSIKMPQMAIILSMIIINLINIVF